MFKRILAIVTACMLMLTAVAFGEAVPAGVTGEFTGTAKGMGGDVTVTIGLKDGEIVSCTAEGPNETPGIGDKAIAVMPGEIAESAEHPRVRNSAASWSSKCRVAVRRLTVPGPTASAVSLAFPSPATKTLRFPPGNRPVSARVIPRSSSASKPTTERRCSRSRWLICPHSTVTYVPMGFPSITAASDDVTDTRLMTHPARR